MELSEKILYCRKKAGFSQETLADAVGVSRQAVSKWETGDAVPELGKLAALAKTFGVTADWLLSKAEPTAGAAPADAHHGSAGKLIGRFGWLAGVYIALDGLGIIFIGALPLLLSLLYGGSVCAPGGAARGLPALLRAVFAFDPLGTVLMGIGLLGLLAGVILAVCLRRRARRG